MSENKSEKIYCNPLWFEEKRFDDGGSILKVNIKAKDMSDFLKQHKDENGYVKIVISKRKVVGDKGQTHYAYLDTWKPSGNVQAKPTTKATAKPQSSPAAASASSDEEF